MRKPEILQGDEEELCKKAKMRAMKLLERSDKTEKQLRDKLRDAGFLPNAIDAAVAYVESFHYLDDNRYARTYLRVHGARKSRRQIRFELEQKGISPDLIVEIFEECDDTEEETLLRLVQKRFSGKEEITFEEYQKGLAYFSRKGFSFDKIKKAMQESLTIL